VDDGKNNASDAIAATQAHLERGEPLAAYNEAQAGLASSPDHPRLRQLQALALARSGDTERANAMLQELAREGVEDAETLGMLARTHKDLALDGNGAAIDRIHLDAAFALYRRAYENAVASGDTGGATYAGINAATLALVRGDLGEARAIAASVRKICDGESTDTDYWREATLGEAALILGEYQACAAHYSKAAAMAAHRLGDKASTRRQSRVLLRHLPDAPPDVAKALAIAPIVAFTGHMIDRPNRVTPRFPASLEIPVRAELRSRLAAIAPAAVYASAACGADLLCLEIARELGAETHIVLPFPAEEFRRVSVDFAGALWSDRFEREIAAASSVTVTSDHYASGSAATFEYANLILTGAARLRAQQLDTSLKAVALSDAGAAPIRGGTAWTLAQWKRAGIDTDRVALESLRAPGASGADAPVTQSQARVRHELRAMLFADAVGYSKLGEDQIPNYIEGFLGAVGKLARSTPHPYEHVEVAGDGLYMVFGTVEDAGRFALQLSELANSFDRSAWSLPPQFNLRIALHCGPVHCARDPITGGPLYTGPHTSRTARIEPITPPGQVYASSAFAAVAMALGANFALSYVGRMPLAKSYGTLGLYHLRGFAVGRSPM
jgi:hypothetical protein